MRVNWRRVPLLLVVVVLLAAIAVPAFQWQPAYADQIINRSLTLQAGDNVTDYDANTDNVIDGGSQAGGMVDHLFDFTVPNPGTDSIGSIKFLYCTAASASEADPGCTTPTGLDTSNVELGQEDAETSGFSIQTGNPNGTVVLTRASATAPGAGNGQLIYRLDRIINPSAVSETFFVRITTYSSIDASVGTEVDDGTVAASTATQIVLSGVMPESLIFCTGENIDLAGNVPDCSTATSGNITFDKLFSSTETVTATSEMAASTNALSGYSITVNGPTLTSGSNTITPMDDGAGGSTASVIGTSQFGMNLVANDGDADDNGTPEPGQPVVGAGLAPVSDGVQDLNGQPTADYGNDNFYEFNIGGEAVANSGFSGSPGPTNGQIYTVSYIVNVTGAQPAGTYATTLTYICTPTF